MAGDDDIAGEVASSVHKTRLNGSQLVKRLLRWLQPCLSGGIGSVQQQTGSTKTTQQATK